MNIYDTKLIRCTTCGKCVGEVDFDAIVTVTKCRHCSKINASSKTHGSSLTSHPFVAAAC